MKNLLSITFLMVCLSVNAQKVKVFDIEKGSANSGPNSLYVANDKIYFYTIDSGFVATSVRTIDKSDNINTVSGIKGGLAFGHRITNITSSVFFAGLDTGGEEELFELKNGTIIKLADQDNYTGMSTRIGNLISHQNKLYYFGRGSNPFGRELYITNPAKNTTKKITNLNTVNLIFSFKDRVYFTARTITNGIELYTYDPVLDIYWLLHETAGGAVSSNPKMFLVHNNMLYYTAYNGSTYAIYEYDGASIPKMLPNSSRNSDFVTLSDNKELGLKAYHNALHFFYHDSVAKKDVFAKYDFANQKVDTIAFNSGVTGFAWYSMKIFNNKLFISGANTLWSYDTSKGVSVIESFPIAYPNNITVFNNYLYFAAAKDSSTGIELYRYNDSTTTIENVSRKFSNITAYPNPAKNAVHIQFNLLESDDLNITLTDIMGQIVYQTGNVLYSASKHTVDIPIAKLPEGSYIYTVSDANGIMHSGKLIKK